MWIPGLKGLMKVNLLELSIFLWINKCEFPQIVWSDAIWGQMSDIAPSHKIRSPDLLPS